MGEPVTATAIATASGIIGAIAGLLKSVGSIFKKGSKEHQEEVVADNTDKEEEKASPYNQEAIAKEVSKSQSSDSSDTSASSESSDSSDSSNLPAVIPSNNLPATTADSSGSQDSADNGVIDMTDQDLTDNGTPQQRSMEKGATAPTPTGSGGIKQWMSDNRFATYAIAGVLIGGAIWIGTAYKKSKEREAETAKMRTRGFNGLEGIDGLDGARRPKRKPTAKKKPKSTPSKTRNTKQTSKKRKVKTVARNSKTGKFIRRVDLL